MSKIKLEEYVAYHCKTEEIARKFLNEAYSQGYSWSISENHDKTNYDIYGSDTTYTLRDDKEIMYGHISSKESVVDVETLFTKSDIQKRLDKMVYEVGDILVDTDGSEVMILAKIGLVYFRSIYDNFNESSSYTYTQEELDMIFKLKETEPKEESIQEFTFEEISNGDATGVPSHLIRIKE